MFCPRFLWLVSKKSFPRSSSVEINRRGQSRNQIDLPVPTGTKRCQGLIGVPVISLEGDCLFEFGEIFFEFSIVFNGFPGID